jgi:hypothetical protein
MGRGCPVCDRDDEDESYFFNHYIPKIKNTPMFMNSPNKDADYQENNEVNKFPYIDRYMLDFNSWGETLTEIESSQTPW